MDEYYFRNMIKKNKLPEVEPVVIPEKIFGIRSGIVILTGLIIAILILFFLLFMLPGIIKGGVYVGFDSDLSDVAIYMDGKYLGSTEGTRYFIESGEHEFVYAKSGIELYSEKIKIAHPIFFTMIFHRSEDIHIKATASIDLENRIKENFISSAASWSKNTDYDGIYSFPPLFSSFAKDINALEMNDYSSELFYATAHISSQAMLDDYMKAKEILQKEGKEPGFDDSFLNNLTFTSDPVSFTYDSKAETKASAYDDGYFTYEGGIVTMGSYQGSTYPLTNEKEIKVQVPSFAIMQYPVSEYEYALFISENPYWSKNNLSNLIADGMVDENYLSSIILSTSFKSTRPIRNISYHAAEAYAAWLSEKTGKTYALPSEAMWTYASLSALDKKYSSSLSIMSDSGLSPEMMFGGLWEMTCSEYIPLARLTDYQSLQNLAQDLNDDIIIKGGSYISDPSAITPDTVGIMKKDATSPYAGFRLVEIL